HDAIPTLFSARRAHAGGLSLQHQPVGGHRIVAQDLTLEDPDLDAADAISGVGFGVGIIDVRTQRVQRNAAFAIPFDARDLRAAQTAAAGDLDAFGAQTQGRLHRPLHRPAESHAAFQLIGNALSNELRIDFRLADLDDVQRHVRRRERAQLLTQLLDVRALLADDDTGTGSVDRYAAQLGGTFDHHLGDRGLRQRLHDELADLEIFQQQTAIVGAFGEPAAVPGAVDLKTQTDRIALVTHVLTPPLLRQLHARQCVRG